MISRGLDPSDFRREDAADHLDPGQRWAIVNGRPTKINILG
jgi:hypothetical protein